MTVVEEQEKKEEDNFDFTPQGEALGYISLAQARMLAMQTAREIPGNYGRRFRSVTMAFDVVESGEDEDYYTVTLWFRPELGFTGTPGQEQFFISKEGEVALRQVLNPPKTKSRWPLVMVIAGVVFAIVALALVASMIFGSKPGPFGGPSPLPPITTVPTPTEIPVAIVAPTDTPIPTNTPVPTKTPGGYYQGRSLVVNVVGIDRVPELRYTIIKKDGPHYLRIAPSENGLELVVVRLKVENHRVPNALLNVDRTAAELRDFLSNKYFPIDVTARVQEIFVPPEPGSPSAQALELKPDGTLPANKGFIRGPIELQKGMGIEGLMVFEAPKGTQFRQFKWRAGDSLTIPLP